MNKYPQIFAKFNKMINIYLVLYSKLSALKRYLENKFFYIGFIIFFVIFFFCFKGNVFSFSRSGIFFAQKNVQVGTNYVRKDLIDDTVVGLVVANIKLGKGDISSNIYIQNDLKSLAQAKMLVNTDPIALIENAANKKNALDTHIKQLTTLMDKLSDYTEQFLELSNENKNEAQNCLNQKNQGDADFFQGFTDDDQETLQQGLAASATAGPCYIKNRIYANAYYKLYDKSNFYKGVLSDKINLLTDNSDTLIENYKVLKDSYLEKLAVLRFKLSKYNGSADTTSETIDVVQ